MNPCSSISSRGGQLSSSVHSQSGLAAASVRRQTYCGVHGSPTSTRVMQHSPGVHNIESVKIAGKFKCRGLSDRDLLTAIECVCEGARGLARPSSVSKASTSAPIFAAATNRKPLLVRDSYRERLARSIRPSGFRNSCFANSTLAAVTVLRN